MKNQNALKERIGDCISDEELKSIANFCKFFHSIKEKDKLYSSSLYMNFNKVKNGAEFNYLFSNKEFFNNCTSHATVSYAILSEFPKSILNKLFIVRGLPDHYFLVFIGDKGIPVQIDPWGFNLTCKFDAENLFEYSISPTFYDLEIQFNQMLNAQVNATNFINKFTIPNSEKCNVLKEQFKTISESVKTNQDIHKEIEKRCENLDKEDIAIPIKVKEPQCFFTLLGSDDFKKEIEHDIKKKKEYDKVLIDNFKKGFEKYITKLDSIFYTQIQSNAKSTNTNLTEDELNKRVVEKRTTKLYDDAKKMNLTIELKDLQDALLESRGTKY